MIYLYVLLLRIVAYLDGPSKIIAFVVVFGLLSYSSLKRVKLNSLNKMPKYVFYALFLVIVILLHSLVFGKIMIRDIAVLLTYWMWLTFTFIYFKDKTINEALKYVLIAFLIFNFANYLYFKLYFADQKWGYNSIMAIFGIVDYRIFFPLSSGANIFTSQLALNALVALYFVKISFKKLINIIVYCFYLYMLVLADSRMLLLLTLVFSFIYWFSLKRILSFLKKSWLVIGVFIFIFLYIFYNTDIFDGFKRNGEMDGDALSRIQIWTIAIKTYFSDFNVLFGHGLNGLENNVLESTKALLEDQRLQTSHNFFLQNLLDFGLFGVTIILFLIFKILDLTIKLKSYIITILIIMFLIMGFTESIPTFYSFEPTMFFITILSIIISQNERKNIRLFKNNNLLP